MDSNDINKIDWQGRSEVYEESEEGIAYTPTNPDVSTDEEKREGLEEGKKL